PRGAGDCVDGKVGETTRGGLSVSEHATQTADKMSKAVQTMSKPGAGTTPGISSGGVLILTERHPAYRRREARLGSGMERENLAGDGKGKAQAAGTARPKVLMRRRGADRLVVVMKAL